MKRKMKSIKYNCIFPFPSYSIEISVLLRLLDDISRVMRWMGSSFSQISYAPLVVGLFNDFLIFTATYCVVAECPIPDTL